MQRDRREFFTLLAGEALVPAERRHGSDWRRAAAAAAADVYLIDPLALDESLGTLLAVLDRTERRRLLARRGAYSRRLFLASHVGLRRILACYLGVQPAAVAFDRRSDAAKPALAETLAGELQFNLSHTRGLALVAVAHRAAVGVDVEWTGRRGDVLSFARRHFGPCELLRLERTAPDARGAELLRLWTRREAVAKLTGEGLPHAFERGATSDGAEGSSSFHLYDLRLPSVEHVGALAVARAERDGLHCGEN